MERWNHNIHYHPVLLTAIKQAIEARARAPGSLEALDLLALDIGCGEGTLTRDLRKMVAHVIGLDLDLESLQEARAQVKAAQIEYAMADILRAPFVDETFDFITSVATLHHFDAREGLSRIQSLLRPGGTVAILGLARPSSWRDVPFEVAGMALHKAHTMKKEYWEHPSPQVWPPPESYGSMRELSDEVLPGSRFRRHALWRYSIVWTKPVAAQTS